LHLPIFTAGRLRAQLNEKVAAFNESVFAYNQLILNASQEIADRLSTIALLEKEIAIRIHSLINAERIVSLTQERFEHALDNRMAVLIAEDEKLEYEILLASLEYAKQLELISLVKALGGGYHE
jgi:multidrug efflux system outer membrane protein